MKAVQRPKPGQVVVLSYASTASTWGSLQPVLEELKRRGRPAFLVVSPSTRVFLRKHLHSGYADIRQLLAMLSKKERSTLWRRANDLAQSLREHIEAERDGGARDWIYEGLLARSAAARILGDAGAIVADCDIESIRKGFLLGAKSCGVPTAVLQHGLLDERLFPIHARWHYDWGPYFRRKAIALGLSVDQGVSTGAPRLDLLHRMPRGPRLPSVRKLMGGEGQKPLVLVISNVHMAPLFPDQFASFFESIIALVVGGIDVVVKPHSAEGDVRAYARALPSHIFRTLKWLPRRVSLCLALQHCDAMYHTVSAASTESIIIGTPVLWERGTRSITRMDFPDHGGGDWVTAKEIAERCFDLAHSDADRMDTQRRQDAFARNAFANLGTAGPAVANALLEAREMCQTSQSWEG